MIANFVAAMAVFSIFGHTIASPLPGLPGLTYLKPPPLAEHQFSLEQRYDNPYVNNVFKDNILLNIAYLDGRVKSADQINWNELEKPFQYRFALKPGQTFSFHNDVLPKYDGKVAKTTNAHFNYQEGFKSDGYLTGDGVCHLASLIYWTAKDAGLDAEAPTSHDFAKINEIPKEYGVAIYDIPGQNDSNAKQNLYVTNSRPKAVEFVFDYKDNNLKVSVVEEG